MTLKRKVEIGFIAFIRQISATVLEKYYSYQGSELKERKLPGFIVKASGEQEVFEGGSPRNINLEILVMTEIHDNEEGEVPTDETRARVRAIHDEALSAIEAALEAPTAPAALRTFLNAGAAKRPVDDFHFYDITKTGEQAGPEGTFADILSFNVVCQNCDG